MKRLSAILLTFAMAVSLAGCGGKKDPKEIYDDAVKKQKEMASFDADMKMDMSLVHDTETMDISMVMNMKIDGINTESMRYLMDGTTSTMGQNLDTMMYYEGGYCYMEAMGQKFKYTMELEDMVQQVEQNIGASSLDSSYLKDISAKKDGDNQILTYTVDEAKMEEVMEEMMDILGNTAAGIDNASNTIKALSGEMVLNKEGYAISSKANLSMEMVIGGDTATMELEMEVTYNNPGQEVSITAPDGLDSYTEIDASQLGL